MIKKLLSLTALAAMVSSAAVAQTNMNYESWAPTTLSPSNPVGWETFNTSNFGGPDGTTQETSDPGEGSISAKLETKVGFAALTGGSDTAAALLTLNGNLLGGNVLGGVAFTGKPASLDILFKSNPLNGDTCILLAQLQHWDAGAGDNVVDGQAILMVNTAVPTWTSFNAVFNYFTTDTPDTLVILAASAMGGVFTDGLPTPGSTFWVDDLVINFPTGVKSEVKNVERIAAYPNPASSTVRIALNDTKATSIRITDITGKVVKTETVLSNVVNINVENLPVGLYVYQVINNESVVYTNKFNVIR